MRKRNYSKGGDAGGPQLGKVTAGFAVILNTATIYLH